MKTQAWVLSAVMVAGVLMLAAPADAQQRKIVVDGFSAPERTMSLQLSAGGLNLSDDFIDSQGTAQLGGMSLAFRWDPVQWGGLELSVGGYSRLDETGLVNESRGLVTLSWLWYFARHHRHRFYGITGLAGMDTQLQIGNSSYSYGEGGYVLGLGTEWLARKRWLISFDVRALMLNTNDQEKGLVAEEAEPPPGLDRSPFPEQWYTPPEERVGVMFNLGVGYRW